MVLDAEWRFIFLNGVAERLHTPSPGGLLGRRIWEIFPEAVGSPFCSGLERAVRAQRPVSFEASYPRTTRRLGIHAVPAATGLAIYCRDLTEHRRAEEALRESGDRFRTAIEYSGIGMALVAPDGCWLKVNDALCQLLGYSEQELRRLTFQDITHPDDREADSACVCRILAGEIQTYQAEKRYVHKQGHLLWVLLTVSLVRDPAGAPLHFIAQLQDITERKRAEEALKRSQTQLAEAQHLAKVGNWEWEIATDTASGSDELYRLCGLEPIGAPLTFETLLNCVHPDDRARVRDTLEQALRNGKAFSYDCRIVHADGAVLTLCVRGEVILDGGVPVRMVGAAQDVTERARLEAQLVHQAFHDALTGLANRALFRDRLEHALARTDHNRDAVAVLFLDLDDFKTVNDSLGHAEGDRLLVVVAERLLNATRGCDTVARLGGDEFAILLENVRDDADAVRVAERVTAAMQLPFGLRDKEVFVSASIGIVRARGEESDDELLRNADVAMYAAKNRGKGRHEIFEPRMHTAIMERVELGADLRRAIEREEFTLYYQPVVVLETGRITGVEALVRWQHPQRGLVAPAAFIPLAEDTSLILPLGHWVLREACRQACAWQARYPELSLTMSVNLSARQLQQSRLADQIAAALRESGLPPRSLVLEITESVIMQDTEATLTKLHELKALGVQLAIDDFGTGYSSLGYLQRFPLDILKIDKSFVDSVERGGTAAALARMIIALGSMLHLRTVAEGVERLGQQAHLRQLGCELAQGYLFAKPLAAEGVDALLRSAEASLSAESGCGRPGSG